MEYVVNILIGVGASLAASLIWWILLQLYSFETRKRIRAHLVNLNVYMYNFQRSLYYHDYDNALVMAQKIMVVIGDINVSVKPLTYSKKKERIIYTLLNSLHMQIRLFFTFDKGYDDDLQTEKFVRCDKAKELYNGMGNFNESMSILDCSVSLLIQLNAERKPLLRSLSSSMCFGNGIDINKKKELYKNLIYVNAYSNSLGKGVEDYFVLNAKNTMRQKEYEEFIARIK